MHSFKIDATTMLLVPLLLAHVCACSDSVMRRDPSREAASALPEGAGAATADSNSNEVASPGSTSLSPSPSDPGIPAPISGLDRGTDPNTGSSGSARTDAGAPSALADAASETPTQASNCSVEPVTPNATEQTRNVLCYLHEIYGNHILSGQEEGQQR